MQPFLGRQFPACAALLAASAVLPTHASEITDFTGVNVNLNIANVVNGGRGFFASPTSPPNAVIGEGPEFTFNVGASGFATREIQLDFDANGQVAAFAETQSVYGNASFNDFSFDLVFTFPDIEITDATVSGDLVRGNTSVAGLDPAVWTFENESDPSFGKIMTIGTEGGGFRVPRLDFDAVPEPSSLALFTLGGLALARRRKP